MAEKDIGALVVTLEAQTAAFEKGMQSATQELQKFGNASKAVESQFSGIQGAFFKFNNATAALATGMNLVTAAFSKVTGFARTREALDNVQASFKAILGDADRAADLMERVRRVSKELGTDLPQTANAVRRMTIGLRQLGSTNAEIEKVTSTFLKIGAIGGSIEEATGAIFQFSQALGSGTLRGDELISLLERQPLIAQEISKYMSEVLKMGDGSIGALRKLASEGKVTSEILRDALVGASDRVSKEFEDLPKKLSQTLNRIQSGINDFSASLNKELKFNETLSTALDSLASAINYALGNVLQFVKDMKENWEVVKYGVMALAAAISGPLISALVAASIAAVRFAASFGWIGAVVTGAVLIVTAWDRVIEMYKRLEVSILEAYTTTLSFIGMEDEAAAKRIALLNEEIKLIRDKRDGKEKEKTADEAAADSAAKRVDASKKIWESFLEGIEKVKLESSIFEKKIQYLEQLISQEKDPKLLKQWKKQLEDLVASGNEFQAWLISITKVSFGDTLDDMFKQLLEFERLMNTTTDPILFKKYEEGFKRTKAAIEDATDPLAGFKRQIEEVATAAELIPEKLLLIDEALASGKLNPDQAQKLRDQVQGLNSDFKQLSDSITDSIAGNASNAVNNFIDTIGKAKFSFADFTESVLKDIAKIIFQLLIMQPIVESIKRSMSSFGAGSGGPELLNEFFADGGSFERGTGLKQGVYDSPQLFKFADGGVFGSRMGVMGEAGPEAIMPLKRNSSGRLGVEAAPTNITIINNAGADVQATETTNSDGTKQIDIYVERKVKEMFGGGAMDKSMKTSYGLTRVGV
jgi:tape measure domain-containing protein